MLPRQQQQQTLWMKPGNKDRTHSRVKLIMQDPPLSRLSRGCGRLVSSNGRLDVCFTPQDYYIWRDQDSLLRLSNSLMGTESTLPKTYSTRRGALLLYSQHLVSMESSRRPGNRNRKQRAAWRCCQQVEQQLSMLKDLTAAILNHSSNQFFSSRPPVLPPLNLPAASRTLNTKHQQLGPERNTKQPENQSEEKDGQLSTRRRVRLDLDLQIPRTSRTPRTSGTSTPQMEPHPWGQPVALTPEEPERPQISITMKHHSTGELHDRNKNNTGHQAADGGRQDDRGSCGRSMSGSRCGRTIRRAAEQPSNSEFEPNSTSGLVLPPLNAGSCRQNSVMSTLEVVGANGHPSTEIQTVGSGHQDDQPQTGEAEIHLQENPKRCNQQPHFLPLLFPGRDEDPSGDKQREGKVKPERRRVKTEAAERQRGRWFSSDGGSVVLLQPGDDPCLPPEPSGSVAGRRGPGRQSSLAFLQNLQNLCEPSDTNRDVVKGVLPLQLRDIQSSRSVGSLILGPDGEIIRLSLFNNNQDQTEALQVVSTDGQEFPWFILLQPQHTLPEAEEELNTDDPVGDIQQHQSVQKQLLDVLGSAEMDSGTNCAAAFIRNKSNLNPGEKDNGSDGKNLLMEQRGGNTEEEEDDEEEQSSSEHSSHLPASPGSGQIMNFPEAAAAAEEEEPPVDQTKKRQNPENVAVATGKKNAKMVKSEESDKQKTMRKEKRKQKTESDDQSKQEETTNQDEETLDRSVLPSLKKKMREGLRGDLKMKEEEEESAERRKRRLRRRERSTELHVVIPEAAPQKEDPKATSDFKSSSATKHENTKSEKLSDLSANHSVPNNPSSVQSARSLRSVSNQRSLRRSAASSCDWPTAAAGVTSSHGRLSSCSTVMVTEEQLMLNPVKPESSRFRQSQEMKMEEEEMKMKMEEEDAAALHLSQQAERKRQEVERKRREKEEEERRRREKEEEERKRREKEEEERKRREKEEEERKQQMEERMKMELQEERKRRTEELRLKKLEEEEEERRRKMEEEEHRVRREEEQRGRERRRQEEKKRKMERLKRMREEEEQRRRAAVERLQLENQKLQEMDEDQRMDYLHQKEEEEEKVRRRREERRLEQELISRQVALLQQQSAFKRGLLLEAGGLQKTQGVSRPWIYSYFSLMQLLGLKS